MLYYCRLISNCKVTRWWFALLLQSLSTPSVSTPSVSTPPLELRVPQNQQVILWFNRVCSLLFLSGWVNLDVPYPVLLLTWVTLNIVYMCDKLGLEYHWVQLALGIGYYLSSRFVEFVYNIMYFLFLEKDSQDLLYDKTSYAHQEDNEWKM